MWTEMWHHLIELLLSIVTAFDTTQSNVISLKKIKNHFNSVVFWNDTPHSGWWLLYKHFASTRSKCGYVHVCLFLWFVLFAVSFYWFYSSVTLIKHKIEIFISIFIIILPTYNWSNYALLLLLLLCLFIYLYVNLRFVFFLFCFSHHSANFISLCIMFGNLNSLFSCLCIKLVFFCHILIFPSKIYATLCRKVHL